MARSISDLWDCKTTLSSSRLCLRLSIFRSKQFAQKQEELKVLRCRSGNVSVLAERQESYT
jgi:hypothetical protein